MAPTGGRSGSALCPLWEGAADIAGEPKAAVSRAEISHCGKPLTCSSPIRYPVALARAADAFGSVEETRVHHTPRRGGGLAAHGTRAATSDAHCGFCKRPITVRLCLSRRGI